MVPLRDAYHAVLPLGPLRSSLRPNYETCVLWETWFAARVPFSSSVSDASHVNVHVSPCCVEETFDVGDEHPTARLKLKTFRPQYTEICAEDMH